MTAAVLLGVGATGGFHARTAVDEESAARTLRAPLVAGLLEKDPAADGSGFVLPLHNSTDADVRVLDVDLAGWHTVAHGAVIPPESWGDVELEIDVSCRMTALPTRIITVRTGSADGVVEQVLVMPAIAGALTAEARRICVAGPDRVPGSRPRLNSDSSGNPGYGSSRVTVPGVQP